MKIKSLFLLVLIFFSCTEFTEKLNSNFLSYKEATISDFNTEFPVVNIQVNQDEFDEMYSNYTKKIEIKAKLNIYRKNEPIIVDEAIEIQIKGGVSIKFELKSLGIKFEKEFKEGNRVLNPKKVLSNHSLKEIKAFRLRNSGNDYYKTLIKDISYTQLAINAELNLDLTYSEPAIVFVNNKFLGIMNLRSEGNTNGISRLRSTEKKDITLAKITTGNVEKKDGDFDRIDAFLEAIKSKNLEYLKAETDIDNFIDYMIFQSYISNIDWPYNNVRFYAVKDEPFRFIVFDLDFANAVKLKEHPLYFIRTVNLGSPSDIKKNPIKDLFNILYSDDAFKTKFDKRYLKILNTKLLSSEAFNQIIETNTIAIENYIPMHIEKYSNVKTIIEWYRNIELLKENYKRREENVNSLHHLF